MHPEYVDSDERKEVQILFNRLCNLSTYLDGLRKFLSRQKLIRNADDQVESFDDVPF